MMNRRFTSTTPALVASLLRAFAGGCAPVAAALPLLAGSVVHAQTTGVADVTPYVGVISAAEKASMRCGPTSSRYTVLEIKTGTPIIIDGEGNGWLRVRYPENTAAFVRAEDVSVSGDTATLVRASTLLAANLISGMDGSWQKLLNDPLPANSTLKVLEPVKDPTGPIIAYRVVAPEQARGFIESRQVRKATDAEAAPLRDKLPKPPATPAGTPATPATPPTTPQPAAPAATDPAATPSTPAGTPQGIDLTQPDSNSDTPVTPAAAPGATPAAAPGAAPDGGAGVVAIDQSPSAATTPPAQPEVRVVDTVESLEAKFQSIWRQPLLSAEVDELISEFDRAIAAAEPGSVRAAQLGQRRDALQLRAEFRNRQRAREEARAALDRTKSTLETQLAELERSRIYTIVGELQPSTVYDGKRLPLMYRLVSVGGAGARTLGYVKPDDRFDLDRKVGRVVGVIGESVLDRSLKLNIVTPSRVDMLKPGDGGTMVIDRETPPGPDGSAK